MGKSIYKIKQNEVHISPRKKFAVQDSTFFPGENFGEHQHSYYEFFLIISGEINQQRNQNREILRTRTLCFLNPENSHSLKNSGNTAVRLINMVIMPEFFEEIATTFGQHLDYSTRDGITLARNIPAGYWNILVTKAEQLLDYSNNPGKLDAALARTLIMDVLFLLANNDHSGKAEIPEWLEFSCGEMQKKTNFREGMPRFVFLSGCTQEHLTRTMRQYMDITPQKMINNLRLTEAASLLRNSKMSVWDVLSDVGFNNESYFRRIFKEKFGCSPKRYSIRCKNMFKPK